MTPRDVPDAAPPPPAVCEAEGGSLPREKDAGPRLVFFSGGTALRDVSRRLPAYTKRSVHLITTFDSGGSTAALRRTFSIPAVGDIRNRMLALADADRVPQGVFDLFQRRLPCEGDVAEMRRQLLGMANPSHPVWGAMPTDYADVIRPQFEGFLKCMTEAFDPRGASIGNLLLVSGYLRHRRSFGPVLDFYSRLLRVQGTVQPIVDESLHLACELEDGSYVSGQHKFKNLTSAINRLFLTVYEPERGGEAFREAECRPFLADAARAHLASADLICFPMGSFYSSILANLLPRGIGRAVASAACPKVFIPNVGDDAELHGLSVAGQVERLLAVLRSDGPEADASGKCPAAADCAPLDAMPASAFVGHVLVDSRFGDYGGRFDEDGVERLSRLGIRVADMALFSSGEGRRHDPDLTVRALMSFLPSEIS
ncbi:MAG: GAK system CofD-like protein [Desulfovibrio sp.]|nr:GAK system CofD-like protein [Desulfovibrio sp.]